MSYSLQVIQGKTDTILDPLVNLGKGVLGGATVYALSNTHYTNLNIALTSAIATFVCAVEFWELSAKQEAHEMGLVPLLRGIQVMSAYYAYERFGRGWAAAPLLEPAFHTLLSLAMTGSLAKRLEIVSHTWGLTTSRPVESK